MIRATHAATFGEALGGTAPIAAEFEAVMPPSGSQRSGGLAQGSRSSSMVVSVAAEAAAVMRLAIERFSGIAADTAFTATPLGPAAVRAAHAQAE